MFNFTSNSKFQDYNNDRNNDDLTLTLLNEDNHIAHAESQVVNEDESKERKAFFLFCTLIVVSGLISGMSSDNQAQKIGAITITSLLCLALLACCIYYGNKTNDMHERPKNFILR